MEFQDIIPLFIFMIWLFSLFGRKKKKANEGSSPQKPSPLKSLLQTIARQLKEQAEAARKEQERKKRQLPDDAGQQRAMPTGSSVSEKKNTIDIALTQEEKQVLEDAASIAEEIQTADPVLQSGHQAGIDPQPAASSASLRQLRNAVVWSEILGDPVALRRDHLKLR